MVVHTPIPAIQEVVCQLELHAYFLRKYLATLLKCIAQYWIAMLMWLYTTSVVKEACKNVEGMTEVHMQLIIIVMIFIALPW